MKKVGILTLNGNGNFGNRLQNYALQTFLKRTENAETIWVTNVGKIKTRQVLKKILGSVLSKYERQKNFVCFTDRFIKPHYFESFDKLDKVYDKFIVGSDQVWNCTFNGFNDNYFLLFSEKKNNISYSASFGIDSIPEQYKEEYINGLNNFKHLSVREDAGKRIVKELINRDDVEVLVDPTMLLTDEEWINISKKPKIYKKEKFVLNYFLGDLSENRKNAIKDFAEKNGCKIINILDKRDPYYSCGPREFLFLEKNAYMICTDSFHSSVFALLFNRPFVVFDREEKNMNNMSSRLDTLIEKFKLVNRKYNGINITNGNFEHDYTEAYAILEKERIKSRDFLLKAINDKECENNVN